jgi:hypothetical protein
MVAQLPKSSSSSGGGSAVIATVGPSISTATSVSFTLGDDVAAGLYRVSLVVQVTDTSAGTCNINATTTVSTLAGGIDGGYQYTLIDSDTPRNSLSLVDVDVQSQGANLVYIAATDDINIDITTTGGGCTSLGYRYIAKLERL